MLNAGHVLGKPPTSLRKNVRSADRAARDVLGIVALGLAFTTYHVIDGGIPGITAAVVGVVMLATAAAGMCPLYLRFKLSMCAASAR